MFYLDQSEDILTESQVPFCTATLVIFFSFVALKSRVKFKKLINRKASKMIVQRSIAIKR